MVLSESRARGFDQHGPRPASSGLLKSCEDTAHTHTVGCVCRYPIICGTKRTQSLHTMGGWVQVFGVALVHRTVPNLVAFCRFSSHSVVAGSCLNMGCPKCEGWWWATWANMRHFGCELGPAWGWCGAAWASLGQLGGHVEPTWGRWCQLGPTRANTVATWCHLGSVGGWQLGATLNECQSPHLPCVCTTSHTTSNHTTTQTIAHRPTMH